MTTLLLVNPLNGFNGGGGPVTSLSFIAETSQSNGGATLTAMTGISAGDVLVFVDWAVRSGSTTIPATAHPSGFTAIDTRGLSDGGLNMAWRYCTSYKIADGSESGATLTGIEDVGSDKKVLFQYRGNQPVTGLSVSSTLNYELTAGNPALQTMAASTDGRTGIVLYVATFRAATDANPISDNYTPDSTVNSGGVAAPHVTQVYATTTIIDATVDMGDEGAWTGMASYYLYNFLPNT